MSDEYTNLVLKTKSFRFKIMKIEALVNLLNQCGAACTKPLDAGIARIPGVLKLQRDIRVRHQLGRTIRPLDQAKSVVEFVPAQKGKLFWIRNPI